MAEKINFSSGRDDLDEIVPSVRSFLQKSTLNIVIDGKKIKGCRTPDTKSFWIRDFSDMLRGLRYFEKDITSLIDHFADTQAVNGRIFDYFTVFPEKLPSERENWTKYVRVPVEADVEYRFVKAVFLAWQATGDDEWLRSKIPALEKALNYVLTHPWRWDSDSGLVKRAYTIDTWDFAYTAGRHDWLQFQIDEHTFWGIMHGDNSGYYEAFSLLARIFRYFGKKVEARKWRERAEAVKSALNRTCWNGRFYTHFVKLTPVDIPGVDEAEQLSLSNPIAVNRGAADSDMAASIIKEYRRRGRKSAAFAEWFSLDPPFPGGIFGDEKIKPGAYVNGGIMPLVGGELARAAFECGEEAYGVDILRRYAALVRETGSSFLWYFPDGTPSSPETGTSPEAVPYDAWGGSAMLYALVEGLAGIEDRESLFRKIRLSPRWPAASAANRAEVRLEYAASGAFVEYSWKREADIMILEAHSSGSEWDFHFLLPLGIRGQAVEINGEQVEWKHEEVGSSCYLNCTWGYSGAVSVRIRLS